MKLVFNYGHLRKRHRERNLWSKKLAIAWRRRRRRKRLNERRPSYFSSFSSLPLLLTSREFSVLNVSPCSFVFIRHEPVIAGSSAAGRSFRDGIFKHLSIPGIDSASLCSLAGRYNNPVPTRFLVPLIVLKYQHRLLKPGGIFISSSWVIFTFKMGGQYDYQKWFDL